MRRIHPVILCGGTGTRLWPLSRRLLPKQFLPLVTERPLLQDTILRIADLPDVERPIVISNNDHRFLVAEQLNELGVKPAVQILEPVGRNTAPAVAVAALHVRQDDRMRCCSCCLPITPSATLLPFARRCSSRGESPVKISW